jgi:hypothetical protein
MFGRYSTAILSILVFVLMLTYLGQPAYADWSVSFYGESRPHRTYYYGDRVSNEYRRGYQVDDWIERGASSVTESPIYADGIRLASWSTRYEDDYEYGLASAIYFFEVPYRARSVRIKISYEGEADRGHFDDDIAGRIWIRRSHLDREYEEYYPREGRYGDFDEPLYGDTFTLRANKHFEIIRLSADDHVVDGMMELHVVAEGRQQIDVKYIEVETYTSSPTVRVITRYHRDYDWDPWYNYTYWYFYTGPTYHFADYYYVRYTYPHYHTHYVQIRKHYTNYLRVYHVKYPEHRVRSVNVVRVTKGTPRTWDKKHLNAWTASHEEARKTYVITSAKRRRPNEMRTVRTKVRGVLATHNRTAPTTITRSSSRTTTVETPATKRRRDVSTSRSVQTRTYSDVSRSYNSSPARSSTDGNEKTRREDTRSSIRTRSSISRQTEPQREVRSSITTDTKREVERKSSSSSQQTKVRRESSRSSSSDVRRAPSRSSSSSSRSQSSSRQVEVKRNSKDDDDDDDDDNKSSRSSSSSRRSSSRSSGSSSSKRRRSSTR